MTTSAARNDYENRRATWYDCQSPWLLELLGMSIGTSLLSESARDTFKFKRVMRLTHRGDSIGCILVPKRHPGWAQQTPMLKAGTQSGCLELIHESGIISEDWRR